jgi:hypothetical protein
MTERSNIESSQVPALAAATAAGATPLLGLIGRPSVTHNPLVNPQGSKYDNLSDFVKSLRKGDVLVTKSRDKSLKEKLFSLASPDGFFHAETVLMPNKASWIGKAPSRSSIKKMRSLTERFGPGRDTPIVVLRPKGSTVAQQQEFAENATNRILGREFGIGEMLSSALHDTFVPKINNTGSNVFCEKGVCSTAPAEAFFQQTGKRVVPGVPISKTLPHHLMMSPEFEAVSHYIPKNYSTTPTLLDRIRPYALRGTLGAGLAAGTYLGVRSLQDYLRNKQMLDESENT